MSTIPEIKNALKVINKYHNNVAILHCVSDYPTKIKNSNLKNFTFKKDISKNEIGLSDHTTGISTSVIALKLVFLT